MSSPLVTAAHFDISSLVMVLFLLGFVGLGQVLGRKGFDAQDASLYATFNKRRAGRFHRHDAAGGITELESDLRGKETFNDPANIIRSDRLFEPLIDRKTWDAVQKKLRGRTKQVHVPRNSTLYFAGLLVCSGCGRPMIGKKDREEYFCSSWNRHRTKGDLANSPCERNPVRQSVIEGFVARYLEETGKRLELLARPSDGEHLTDRLKEQEDTTWIALRDGVTRLTGYLAEHHPEEYAAIVSEFNAQRADAQRADASFGSPGLPPGTLAKDPAFRKAHDRVMKTKVATGVAKDDFIEACVGCYKAHFDPTLVASEIATHEAEYDSLMKQWADLPTPKAKEKAKERFLVLEARIEELKKQQQDASEVVLTHHQQLRDLQDAIDAAKLAMKSESGERALRQRAEALRSILSRIDCAFVSTGKKSRGGRCHGTSKLVSLTFHPIAGVSRTLASDGSGGNEGFQFHGFAWNSFGSLTSSPPTSAASRVTSSGRCRLRLIGFIASDERG